MRHASWSTGATFFEIAVCCWFSPCSKAFSLDSPVSPLHKNEHSKFQFDQVRGPARKPAAETEVASCLNIVIFLFSLVQLIKVKWLFHLQACLYLYDVPSVDHPGQILGSVVFGESFLDSAIKTLVPGTNHLLVLLCLRCRTCYNQISCLFGLYDSQTVQVYGTAHLYSWRKTSLDLFLGR